jgi:hypothetical protein
VSTRCPCGLGRIRPGAALDPPGNPGQNRRRTFSPERKSRVQDTLQARSTPRRHAREQRVHPGRRKMGLRARGRGMSGGRAIRTRAGRDAGPWISNPVPYRSASPPSCPSRVRTSVSRVRTWHPCRLDQRAPHPTCGRSPPSGGWGVAPQIILPLSGPRSPRAHLSQSGSAYGNRTRVSGMRIRCLHPWTNAPKVFFCFP